MFKTVKPEEERKLENAVNISSYGSKPYNLFSPFTYSQDFKIPVPGLNGIFSHSVESIWQGLKVINEQTDFELFSRKPKKRKGLVEGHLFYGQLLDISNARKKIYRPSYFYYLDNYVPEEIKENLLIKVFDQWEVCLYDVEDNLDIEKPDPFAHSVFACEYLNTYLDNMLTDAKNKIDAEYDKKELPHETLAEPLSRAIKLFEDSSEFEKKLAVYFLRFNKQVRDIYHGRYYIKLFEKLERL